MKTIYYSLGVCCAMSVLCAQSPQDTHAFIIDPDAIPWTTTASGNRSGNGVAGTLTWSIVPDGTSITDGMTALGGSDLNAFLNSTFTGATSGQSIISQAFQRWDDLSGLSFVYEPNDDGGSHNNKPGVLGVRGDVRVGGASYDDAGGTLAFNFIPNAGSDMVLDTDDSAAFSDSDNNYRFIRNTIMHEIGHGFSLSHVTSGSDRLLLEPVIDTAFDGPQLDEIRAIHFYFGDSYEEENNGVGNGNVIRASDLGSLAIGGSIEIGEDADVATQAVSPAATDFVSISNIDDLDFYSFTVTEYSAVSAKLTPLGGTFTQSGVGGNPTSFDASARSNLSFSILDSNGITVLATADSTGLGGSELLMSVVLDPGTYYTRIRGAEDTVQLYSLTLELASLPGDFNADGSVDVADYTVWRDLLNTNVSPGTAADGNADGSIDLDDYQIWASNFGTVYSNSSAAVFAIPEPSTGLLCGMITVLGFLRRRYPKAC